MHLDSRTVKTPYFRKAAVFLLENGERDMRIFLEDCIEQEFKVINALPRDTTFREKKIGEPYFVSSMEKFFSATKPMGFRPFLAFGSLLGYVREGKFIDWDRDLDICFLYKETDVVRLEKALRNAGFRILESDVQGPPYKMKCQWKEEGHLVIDIAFFLDDGHNLITYARTNGQHIARRRTFFSLSEVEYYGISIFVPTQAEVFLTENYGDWRKPKVTHHYIFDSQLTDFSGERIKHLALDYFLICLLKKEWAKVEHYLVLFTEKFNTDPFWLHLNRRYGKSNIH
jgi:hypothetical protein